MGVGSCHHFFGSIRSVQWPESTPTSRQFRLDDSPLPAISGRRPGCSPAVFATAGLKGHGFPRCVVVTYHSIQSKFVLVRPGSDVGYELHELAGRHVLRHLCAQEPTLLVRPIYTHHLRQFRPAQELYALDLLIRYPELPRLGALARVLLRRELQPGALVVLTEIAEYDVVGRPSPEYQP